MNQPVDLVILLNCQAALGTCGHSGPVLCGRWHLSEDILKLNQNRCVHEPGMRKTKSSNEPNALFRRVSFYHPAHAFPVVNSFHHFSVTTVWAFMFFLSFLLRMCVQCSMSKWGYAVCHVNVNSEVWPWKLGRISCFSNHIFRRVSWCPETSVSIGHKSLVHL